MLDFGDWIAVTDDQQRDVYNVDVTSLAGEERAAYVRLNTLAATDELHEAMAECQWKPWKKNIGHVNRDRMLGEIVDVLNFVGNLLAMLDVDGEELSEAYMEKLAENRRRMEEGY